MIDREALAMLFGLAVLGCNDKSATSPPKAAPSGSAIPTSEVARETLAAMGYFGDAESRAAWDAHEAKGCPGALDGSEMIGRVLPEWHLEQWQGGDARTLADLRGRVVVVRFWMAPGCPFCEKSMPALQDLSEELADEPVTFVGAFHSKPVEAHTTMALAKKVAGAWGITFPIALDRDWNTLKAWWLADGAHRHATSVTFVIGKNGKLAFVHPGPVFHPSDDPDEAKENRDYLELRAAILRALG